MLSLDYPQTQGFSRVDTNMPSEHIGMTVMPNNTYGYPEDVLRYTNGQLLKFLQASYDNGGSLSKHVYTQAASNGFANNYYGSMLQRTLDIIVRLAGGDQQASRTPQLIDHAINLTTKIFMKSEFDKYPAMQQQITQVAYEDMMRLSKAAAQVLGDIVGNYNRTNRQSQFRPQPQQHQNPTGTRWDFTVKTDNRGVGADIPLPAGVQMQNVSDSTRHIVGTIPSWELSTEIPETENIALKVEAVSVEEGVGTRQKELLHHHFGGDVPPAGTLIYGDTDNNEGVYAYPINCLNDIWLRVPNPVIIYNDNNEISQVLPHISAYSSDECAYVVLDDEGDSYRQLILKKEDLGMKVEDHVPAGFKINWEIVGTAPIGAFEGQGAIVHKDPIVGSMDDTATIAHSFARALLDEFQMGKPLTRVLEYTNTTSKQFYVDKVNDVNNLIGSHRSVKSLPHLINGIATSRNLSIQLKHHMLQLATKVINDMIAYAMGLNITINDATDIEELVEALEHDEDFGSTTAHGTFVKWYPRMCAQICTAVPFSKIKQNIKLDIKSYDENQLLDEKKLNHLNKKTVVVNSTTQVTELPWLFEELGVELFCKEDVTGLCPSGLVRKVSALGDFYTALEEIVGRCSTDVQFIEIITSDMVRMNVIESAYDSGSFVLVRRS